MEHITICNSIDDVRLNIDRIDFQLVSLIAERAQYVKQAAKFKKNTTEVKASDRVEQVINKVVTQANELKAPPAVVEAIYRTMIDQFIKTELEEHKSLNQQHT